MVEYHKLVGEPGVAGSLGADSNVGPQGPLGDSVDEALIADALAKRVFVVAYGGSLPTQHDDHGAPVIVNQDINVDGSPRGVVLTILPKIAESRPSFPFRESQFSVLPEVVVGTIDELVAHYRERLVAAARGMVSIPWFKFQDHEKIAAAAVALYGYKPGAAAACSPLRPYDQPVIDVRRRQIAMYDKLKEDNNDAAGRGARGGDHGTPRDGAH